MTLPDISDDAALVTEVTREAGDLAFSFFGSDVSVRMKAGDSPVSEADESVDSFLRERLCSARPTYGWLSEETEDDSSRLSASRTFVVDPIDGTRGFINGDEEWCVSVAIVENGRPIVGVLVAPCLKKTLSATIGSGIFLNGVPHTRIPHNSERIIVSGFSSSSLDNHQKSRYQKTRFIPSLAWRFALVAFGESDGVWVKGNVHDWDIAAADLIVHESGGLVTNLSSDSLTYNESDITKRSVLASSSCHDELLSIAKETI